MKRGAIVQFESVADALAMGGHGPYVWSVYLAASLVVLFLLLAPVRRSRRLRRDHRGRLRR